VNENTRPGFLIIIVVGAICFWAIDRFAGDRRLAQLLKLLVVLICLGAILRRVLPLAAADEFIRPSREMVRATSRTLAGA
jgi:uncharacterized membrane protein